MPVIGLNYITPEYVNGYPLGNIYLGSTLVQGGIVTPLVTDGLVAYYDFNNPISYPGSGLTVYGLTSPTTLSPYTGTLDTYDTPSTASYLVDLGGTIGNALYYPNVNDGNNVQFNPVTSGSGSVVYEDWTFVAAIRYDQIPNPPGGLDYATVWYTSTANHEMAVYNNGSMEIRIDGAARVSFPAGTFILGDWYIFQVAVSYSNNPQIKYNINNNLTGSFQFGPTLSTPYSLLRQNYEGGGINETAGKGYTQVFGVYNRQLTAEEMVSNFTLLNTRYGI